MDLHLQKESVTFNSLRDDVLLTLFVTSSLETVVSDSIVALELIKFFKGMGFKCNESAQNTVLSMYISSKPFNKIFRCTQKFMSKDIMQHQFLMKFQSIFS